MHQVMPLNTARRSPECGFQTICRRCLVLAVNVSHVASHKYLTHAGRGRSMEGMNLLDVTIKYFNVIVFVLCVLFGMTSFLASWVAWREIKKKNNIVRSVLAAYNVVEETLEKGRSADGDVVLEPSVVETVFNSVQEILNVIYGEMTGKPIPPRDERLHGSRKTSRVRKGSDRTRPLETAPMEIDGQRVEYIEEEDQPGRHVYHP